MLGLSLQICASFRIHIDATKLLRDHGRISPYQEKRDRIQWSKGLKGNNATRMLNWDWSRRCRLKGGYGEE